MVVPAPLDTLENREAASRGMVEDWATESLLAARAAYQVPETGKRIKPRLKLAESFQEANLPVVRRRLYHAGVRLALVLNEAFPESRYDRRTSRPDGEVPSGAAVWPPSWPPGPSCRGDHGILAIVKKVRRG